MISTNLIVFSQICEDYVLKLLCCERGQIIELSKVDGNLDFLSFGVVNRHLKFRFVVEFTLDFAALYRIIVVLSRLLI